MGLREFSLLDFSGGLNLRDAPSELANNESPDLWNVTLDERGGMQKRLGYAKKNQTPYATSLPSQALYEWQGGLTIVTQCGQSVFLDDTPAAVHTFTTADRAGFTEFSDAATGLNYLYAIHPVDGLWRTADGTVWTQITGGPKGSTLAVWQNRMLAGGDKDHPTRLSASAIGDPTDWTTAEGHGWTNDIREGNDQTILALKGASGVDIDGRPGLLVVKRHSTHRVNDSNTGAYTTIDSAVGCASSLAIVDTLDRTVMISEQGIFLTDGNGPWQLKSGKIQPLFAGSQIAFDRLDLFCAGAISDRVHFSLPRAGSTANDLHLEYHPAQGWIVAGSDAASCYATDTNDGKKLYGGSPTVPGQVYELGVGGADDGAPITCRYQTKWIQPFNGLKATFRRVRVSGRGIFDLYTKFDFDQGDGDLTPVFLVGDSGVWDVDDWDAGQWGPGAYEDTEDFYSLGQGVAVSFVFKETSDIAGAAPQLLGTGQAPAAGSFAVYGLLLQAISVGI